ncbi:MAG: formylmethanofuran dehydrogenase subunit E family protein [Nitrososphaerales archaeon]
MFIDKNLLIGAKNFHGHLGPFIVLGMRIGLSGLRLLNLSKGDNKLHIVANLNYKTPISCILDGLQLTSGCTLGNTRLTIKESEEISVRFIIKGKDALEIKVNPLIIKKLLKKPMKTTEELESLAYDIAETAEKDLFIITKLE